MMPDGNSRSMKIVERGYCPDTRYEELQEKEAQHEELWIQGYPTAYNSRTIRFIVPHYIFAIG